jgi:hypothetical protein
MSNAITAEKCYVLDAGAVFVVSSIELIMPVFVNLLFVDSLVSGEARMRAFVFLVQGLFASKSSFSGAWQR